MYDIFRARYLNDEPYSMEYTIMPRKIIPEITDEILYHSIYPYIQNELTCVLAQQQEELEQINQTIMIKLIWIAINTTLYWR